MPENLLDLVPRVGHPDMSVLLKGLTCHVQDGDLFCGELVFAPHSDEQGAASPAGMRGGPVSRVTLTHGMGLDVLWALRTVPTSRRSPVAKGPTRWTPGHRKMLQGWGRAQQASVRTPARLCGAPTCLVRPHMVLASEAKSLLGPGSSRCPRVSTCLCSPPISKREPRVCTNTLFAPFI